jgi:hypothetical protein
MTGMDVSYILIITAFYVDNRPNLPLWRELPSLAFWTLPTFIGAPILIGTKLVKTLRERGYEVVPASPSSGVNTITGEAANMMPIWPVGRFLTC